MRRKPAEGDLAICRALKISTEVKIALPDPLKCPLKCGGDVLTFFLP
jgi:hypothetical protein